MDGILLLSVSTSRVRQLPGSKSLQARAYRLLYKEGEPWTKLLYNRHCMFHSSDLDLEPISVGAGSGPRLKPVNAGVSQSLTIAPLGRHHNSRDLPDGIPFSVSGGAMCGAQTTVLLEFRGFGFRVSFVYHHLMGPLTFS